MVSAHGSDVSSEPPVVLMRDLTAEQYFTLPPSTHAQYLIDGVLYASPRADEAHDRVAFAIAEALDAAAAGAGRVVMGRECWLDDATVLAPHVAYVRAVRASIVGRYLRGAPDLAIEVVTAASADLVGRLKLEAYRAAGVTEIWLVDPDAEQVAVIEGASGIERHAWFGTTIESTVFPTAGTAGLATRDRGA